MSFRSRSSSLFSPEVYLPLLFGTLGLLVTAFVAWELHTREAQLLEAELAREARDRLSELQEEARHEILFIRSLAGLFQASQRVDPEELRRFAALLDPQSHGIQGLAWAPWRPATEPLPVTLAVAPEEDRLTGLDLRSVPGAPEALARAVATGSPVTLPLSAAEAGSDLTYLWALPVQGSDPANDARASTAAAPEGFVVTPFHPHDLLTSFLETEPVRGFDVYLYEETETAEEILVHFQPSRSRQVPVSPLPLDAVRDGLHWEGTVNVAGLTWWAVIRPVPGLLRGMRSDRPTAALLVGLLLTAGIAGYLFYSERSHRRLGAEVAERQQALRALQESESRYRELVESVNDVVYSVDVSEDPLAGRLLFLSPRIGEITGCSHEEFAADPALWIELLHPEDAPAVTEATRRAVEEGVTVVRSYRMLHRPSDTYRWLEDTVRPEVGPDCRVVRLFGVARDVTERHKAQEALERRDAVLEAVAVAGQTLFRVSDPEEATPEILRLLGEATEVDRAFLYQVTSHDGQLAPTLLQEWAASRAPLRRGDGLVETLPLHRWGFAEWEGALRRGEAVHGRRSDFPRPFRDLLDAAGVQSIVVTPVFAAGELWGLLGGSNLETKRVWSGPTVDALRAGAATIGAAVGRHLAFRALESREEELRQAQKMEAVGRLATGVAHDFNNLLTVMTGYAQLLKRRLAGSESPEAHRQCDEILHAADRAADLSRRLLLFGRRRSFDPGRVDLGETVVQTEKMLGRLLGADVEIETHLSRDVPPVLADPALLEQVILNLAVNARDAMSDGGTLTLATSTSVTDGSDALPAGTWAVLTVADTGHGIPEEIQGKIFEPFFTTKEEGKGTGLGLSTVYGIVQQSGGAVRLESRPGAGATFRIFLPKAKSRPEETIAPEAEVATVTGSETLLLVDDHEQVRALTADVLRDLGYRVIETGGPDEARREALLAAGELDLLLTDIDLPVRNGYQLAAELTALWPDLPVLFVSGLPEGSLDRGETDVPAGASFLQKPYQPEELGQAVRATLDR